jgi:hypothetical protein
MTTFALSFLIIVLAVLGMALGAIVTKRPIVSGCQIVRGLGLEEAGCEVCSGSCLADRGSVNDPPKSPAAER